jgi:hypothetical protein
MRRRRACVMRVVRVLLLILLEGLLGEMVMILDQIRADVDDDAAT